MKIIGHRGAAGLVAENTLESIAEALNYKVDGIEIDVHCCKSGEIVVVHDETLDRTTNGKGLVKDYTLSELKQFTTQENFRIPTLIEVLELIDGRCQLNVELKGKETVAPVIKLLETHIKQSNWTYHHFIVSSFDHPQLYVLQKLQPKFRIGVLTEENITAAISVAEELHAYAVHPPIHTLTKEEVVHAQAKGFQVWVWTVNTKSLIKQCKLWNIDGMITDFPNFAL